MADAVRLPADREAAPGPPRRAARPARRAGAAERLLNLQRTAGNAALARVLLDGANQPRSDEDVRQLAERYHDPVQIENENRQATLAALHAETTPYTVREVGRGPGARVVVARYSPPSHFQWGLPAEHVPSMATTTPKIAGNEAGNTYTLTRGNMPANLTQSASAMHPTGFTYAGAGAIQGGASLSDAGLHRTHHLSDSAIRTLLVNICERGKFNDHRVLQWFQAVGGTALGNGLFKELQTAASKGDVTRLGDIASRLSSSPWQVGLGHGDTNEAIGPFFDESRTARGIPTPVASVIAQSTQNLAVFDVADAGLVKAALSQLQSLQTGETMHSMTANPGRSGAGASTGGSRSPASGISPAEFARMRPTGPCPVPPGTYHAGQLENVYQAIDLLQRAKEPVADVLLAMFEEPDTRKLMEHIRKLVFVVGPDGVSVAFV